VAGGELNKRTKNKLITEEQRAEAVMSRINRRQMETRTIKTIVTSTLNEQGRFMMAKLGLPAQAKQSITLNMPLDTIGLQINSEGYGWMNFEYEYNPKLTYEYMHVPDEIHGGGNLPYVYHKKATIWDESLYGLSVPLLSVEDVLQHQLNRKVKLDTVKSLLLTKQAEYDAQYEADVITQKTRIQHLVDVVEARKQLEAEYQNAVNKLAAIRELIDGKQRVRTAQIGNLID
jgi:hypothetical protein